MIPTDLTYGWPFAAILGVLLVPILLLQWRLYHYRRHAMAALGLPEIIREVTDPRMMPVFWIKTLCLSILWIALVIALMQPEGNAHYAQADVSKKIKNALGRRRAHDILFLVDASASMGLEDSRDGRSRLDYAKDIADQIVSRLEGENAGVMAFTSETTQLSPMTLDYLFVRLMLRQMEINEGNVPGTDLLVALENAKKQNFQNLSPKLRTLILLTDGGDTLLESLEGNTKDERQEKILNTLNVADELNLRVYTVGMGSRKGGIVPSVSFQGHSVESALADSLLQSLARRGRGNYYEANAMSSLEIADEIAKELKRDPQVLGEAEAYKSIPLAKDKIYDQYYQIPLGFSILLLVAIILYPDVRKARI